VSSRFPTFMHKDLSFSEAPRGFFNASDLTRRRCVFIRLALEEIFRSPPFPLIYSFLDTFSVAFCLCRSCPTFRANRPHSYVLLFMHNSVFSPPPWRITFGRPLPIYFYLCPIVAGKRSCFFALTPKPDLLQRLHQQPSGLSSLSPFSKALLVSSRFFGVLFFLAAVCWGGRRKTPHTANPPKLLNPNHQNPPTNKTPPPPNQQFPQRLLLPTANRWSPPPTPQAKGLHPSLSPVRKSPCPFLVISSFLSMIGFFWTSRSHLFFLGTRSPSNYLLDRTSPL